MHSRLARLGCGLGAALLSASPSLAQCSPWEPLPPGTNDLIETLVTFDDGTGPALYAGGWFTWAGSVSAARRIARWNGAGWSKLGSGLGVPGGGHDGTNVHALAVYDDGSGPALYAGGSFDQAGGSFARSIAKWDGTSWFPLGAGVGGSSVVVPETVYALAVYDDGDGPALYAGGSFTSAGGVPAAHVAKWNGASWSALGGLGAGTNGLVYALSTFDDGTGEVLVAGGVFTEAGGIPASSVAQWNGSSWSPLGSGMNGFPVRELLEYDDGTGPVLVAGGFFPTAGGVSAPCIARWNGLFWSAFGPPGSGMNGYVRALTVFDDGSGPALFAGGDFTAAGGTPALRIAKWDGSSWSAAGAIGPGSLPGVNTPSVQALAVFADASGPALFVAGYFDTIDGNPIDYIARWRGCVQPNAYCFGDGTTVTDCPCGNFGLAGHGCENSESTGGALLDASGSTSPDTALLSASGEYSVATTIFLQGNASLPSGVLFGDGVRCVGGSLKRIGVKTAVGGTTSYPGAGDPSVSARSAALGDTIAPGTTRYYQAYYRDPNLAFCPAPAGNSWNLTNAIRILW